MTVRMRHTKGHRNNRRAHHALAKPAVSLEGEAKVPHLRHRANPTTGTYKGITVASLEKKNSKRIQKEAAKNS
jgi:ribosomal protein L32